MPRLLTALCLLLLALAPARADSADPWPKSSVVGGATYTLYQPQLEKWDGFNFVGHAALSVQPSGAQQPIFGAMNFTATTEVNKVTRMVHFENLKITQVTFPSAQSQAAAYQQAFQSALNGKEGDVPLDRLETALAIQKAQASQRGVKVLNPVPRFVFTQQPAVLVRVQGQPVWGPVKGSAMRRLMNTRPLVLMDATGTVYLHVLDGWVQAGSLNGPWTVSTTLPPDADSIATQLSSQHLVDLLQPPPNTQNAPSLKTTVPQVYVATGPTELIVFQGAPEWTAATPDLQYVSNTTGNVFKDLIDQNYYVLVTGRWFRARDLSGPWSFVMARALPAEFAAIPDDSPKENVKACIPGTAQAQEALIANSIPHTATVTPGQVTFQPQIQGTPNLVPIGGTSLSSVVNSPVPIIEVPQQGFYACQNGVWFTAKQLTGPWTVALTVPAVIYNIPSDSPLHYVTYVRIYQTTPTIVMGYTPGYMGAFVDPDAVVVYGTGYDYPPYVTDTVYYPAPDTYGYGAEMAWTPGTGWAFGMGFGWGVATADAWGWGWGCPPYWGAWGPYSYGYPGYAAWGPGGWASTTGNVYSRWGNTGVVTRESAGFNAWTGNSWTNHYAASYNSVTGRESAGQRATVNNVYTGNSASGARGATYNPNTGRTTSAGGAVINTANGTDTIGRAGTYNSRTGNYSGAVDVNNNVYADHNGNIYRNTDDGWQKYNGSGSWNDVSRQSNTTLQSQASARGWGEERTNSWGNAGGLGDRNGAWRSGGFDRGGFNGGFNRGSFRGGFGGFRGRR